MKKKKNENLYQLTDSLLELLLEPKIESMHNERICIQSKLFPKQFSLLTVLSVNVVLVDLLLLI